MGFLIIVGIIVFIAMLTIGSHAKLSDYFFVVGADIAFALCNVSLKKLFRRPVGWSPLVRVAVLRHECPGMGVERHDAGKVAEFGVSDVHSFTSLFLAC